MAHSRWRNHDKVCPLCRGELLLHAPSIPVEREWRQLNVEDFFRALCGFGLPDQLGCAPEIISSLLAANTIVGVDMAIAGGDRTVVFSINLNNGLKLHMASSPEGPCIYKITRAQYGNSDSSHLSKKTTDDTIQCPHQGVPAAGEKADLSERAGDAGSDINAEGAGRVASTDTALQECSDMDAGNPMGTSAGGSSNSAGS